MIDIKLIRVGCRVEYCTVGKKPEVGTVVEIHGELVFIRFDGELHAKACYPRDLYFWIGE